MPIEVPRRSVLVAGAAAPILAVMGAGVWSTEARGGQDQSAAPPEGQFAPPPDGLSDAELVLLGQAVEAARTKSVSQLVQDERFMALHPQPAFRQLVRGVAKESKLTIAREDEPGTRIIAAGVVQSEAGAPIGGAMVYAYHTSAKGWYAERAAHVRAWAGDQKHARLFGYLKTGADGTFEIRTIRPGGYPRSSLPQHIHFEVEAAGFSPRGTELLFDDDPRLDGEQRKRAERERFIVAKEEGGVFWYGVGMGKE